MNYFERRVKTIFRSIGTAIFVLAVLLVFACSQYPTSGGVSVPNAITGYVYDTLGHPIRDARVIARRIMIDQQGDQVLSHYENRTDIRGHYSFSSIEPGRYVITIKYDNKKIVIPFVDASTSDTVSLGGSVPRTTVVVKGRVVNVADGNLVVTIPGTDARTTTDSLGFYILEEVPVQELRLAFVGPEAVNYLHIDVKYSADTAFIRDVFYATTIEQARGYEPLYFTELPNSFSIIPIDYDSANLPSWYVSRDFNRVEYLLLRNSSYNFTVSSGMWNDPMSWDLFRVPKRGDTAFIRNSICFITNDTILSIIYVDDSAEITLSSNVFFEQAFISNSSIGLYPDSVGVLVSGNVFFEGENYLSSSIGSTVFYNSINGAGAVHVRGTIQLDGVGASAFVGDWYIDAGKLRIRSENGTGTGVVTVGPRGNLDIEHSQALGQTTLLRLISNGTQFPVLELDNQIVVHALEIGGTLMPAGVYTRDTHPNYMIGPGSVTVAE